MGNLVSQQVSELIDRLIGADCVIFGEDALDIIEAIADTDIFDHIARVQDISTCWWNLNYNLSFVRRGLLHDKAHLFCTVSDFFSIEGQSQDSVNVLQLNFKIKIAHRGSHLTFCGSGALIRDLYLLDLMLPITLTILAKLCR